MPIKPQEVFQFLKAEYKYIAMDYKKFWGAYEHQPFINMDKISYGEPYQWTTKDGSWDSEPLTAIDIDYTGDWKESLFGREDYDRWLKYCFCTEPEIIFNYASPIGVCNLCKKEEKPE